MIKDLEFETYLIISQSEFCIYLFDKKNMKNLYEQKLIINDGFDFIDFNLLNKFLDENIFKIEKLIGMFVENIILIINYDKVFKLNLGVKKKNYEESISKKFLESMIVDVKDLFKENYQNEKIMHLVVKKYIIDDDQYFFFKENLKGNKFCIEVEFLSVSENFLYEIEKVLQKYQIKIDQYFDLKHIKSFFKNEDIEFSEMIFKLQNGFIENEVKLIPKSHKKMGFFEKFFQLLS